MFLLYVRGIAKSSIMKIGGEKKKTMLGEEDGVHSVRTRMATKNSFGRRNDQLGCLMSSRRNTPPTTTSPAISSYTTAKSSGSWREEEEGEENEA